MILIDSGSSAFSPPAQTMIDYDEANRWGSITRPERGSWEGSEADRTAASIAALMEQRRAQRPAQ